MNHKQSAHITASHRTWAFGLCAVMVLMVAFSSGTVNTQSRTVRVGVYQNEPKIFMDENGQAAGIFIELLDGMAAQEGWTLVYVQCEWAACLRALEDGQIDLMPDVAYSPERDAKYDFHKIPVLESWSRIYASPGTPINKLSELDGKRVAVLNGSIQQTVFEQLMNGFGYEVTIVPVDSLEQAFGLAADGSADAAIANYFFGNYFYQEYGLVKTTIVFNPVTLYYATAEGRNHDLLDAIDRHLGQWLQEPKSTYYTTLSRWAEQEPAYHVPQYLFWVFGGITGLLVAAAGMVILLRQQVGARTRKLEQANAELQESEQRYQILARISPVGIFRTDPNGATTYVNPKWCLISGLSANQALGDGWLEAVHPDDKEKLSEGWQESTQLHKASFSDYRFMRPDGTIVWVMGQAVPEMNSENQIIGYVGTITDITERKQAEEKLIASEVRYRRLFEAARDGILILDAETGVVIDVNPFLIEMLGFSQEEICGKEFWELGFFKDIAANKANFLELQQKEYIRYEDLPLETTGGRRLHVEFVSNVYQVNHHKVVQCNIRDITGRKQAEEDLIKSEGKFRAIFDNASDGMFIVDLKARKFFMCNIACAKMLGYAQDEFLNLDIADIHPGEDMPFIYEQIGKFSRGEEGIRSDIKFKRKNGSVFASDLSPALLTIAEKEYLLINFKDITERKQAEQALQEYNTRLETDVAERTRELREAHEKLVRQERLATLGQVAGSVGHELRNPLGVISNAVYFLKAVQPDADDRVKEYLDIIENETRTSNKIVADLLDFTHIKSVDREPAAVPELIRQTLECYPVPPSVKVVLELPADLPPVYADPHHVVQVLGNLTVNACQAMPEIGKLTISAAVQSDMIRIAVQDTGIGILHENMSKLFEPLFSTKIKGIGLGLAVSKKLAEANGGRIEVQSEPGKGSTFTVYLPVYEVVPVPARDKEEK
jgi:PAS domain S-box-containing protein